MFRLKVVDIEATSAIDPLANRLRNMFASVCEFALPSLEPYATVEEALIRSDPAPVSLHDLRDCDDYNPLSASSSDTSLDPEQFCLAPINRVFVVNISVFPSVEEDDVQGSDSEYVNLALFIPLKTILPYIFQHCHSPGVVSIYEDPDDEDSVHSHSSGEQMTKSSPFHGPIIRWDDWGPQGTRMLILPREEHVWVCNVFGSRFICPLERNHSDETQLPHSRHFVVLDFNVKDTIRTLKQELGMKRGRDGDDEPESVTDPGPFMAGKSVNIRRNAVDPDLGQVDAMETELFLGPSTISNQKFKIFQEDVTTYLPFACTTSSETHIFDGLMITEDNLLIVKASQIHLREASVFTF